MLVQFTLLQKFPWAVLRQHNTNFDKCQCFRIWLMCFNTFSLISIRIKYTSNFLTWNTYLKLQTQDQIKLTSTNRKESLWNSKHFIHFIKRAYCINPRSRIRPNLWKSWLFICYLTFFLPRGEKSPWPKYWIGMFLLIHKSLSFNISHH